MDLLVDLAINLLITALAYLLVPMICLTARKKFEAKTIKRISIINCVVVWLLFRIIQIELGNGPSSGAAVFLWGAIGYSLLKRFCLQEDDDEVGNSNPIEAESQPVHICLSNEDEDSSYHYGNYHVYGKDIRLNATEAKTEVPRHSEPIYYDNPVTDEPKRIDWKTVAIVGVSILAVVSFAWNIILLNKNANLEKGVAAIQEEKQIYYNYWIDSFEEIAFYDEYVVFVEDNNTNLYHKYNCSRFGDEVFWAYNIDAAIDKGYDPCPLCCD